MIKLLLKSIAISSLIFLPIMLGDIIEISIKNEFLITITTISLVLFFWGIVFFLATQMDEKKKFLISKLGLNEYKQQYPFGATQIGIVIIGIIISLFTLVKLIDFLK